MPWERVQRMGGGITASVRKSGGTLQVFINLSKSVCKEWSLHPHAGVKVFKGVGPHAGKVQIVPMSRKASKEADEYQLRSSGTAASPTYPLVLAVRASAFGLSEEHEATPVVAVRDGDGSLVVTFPTSWSSPAKKGGKSG